MDIEKWSKKAKIAGLVITGILGMIAAGQIDAIVGLPVIGVVAVAYLWCQGRIDEIKEQCKDMTKFVVEKPKEDE